MYENEIGLREGRAQFGELVNRAEYTGHTTYITRHGRRVAAIVPILQEDPATAVIWSVVPADSPIVPTLRAFEPEIVRIAVPLDILDWAKSHGFSETTREESEETPEVERFPKDAPTSYLLVSPKEDAGEIPDEIPQIEGEVSLDEINRLQGIIDANR